MTPVERDEYDWEMLRLQIKGMSTDRLLDVRAMIDKLLTGHPHLVPVGEPL